MIGRLGGIVLACGMVAALCATVLWLRVALSGTATRPARIAGGITFAAGLLACGLLESALVAHDFSVAYVAENGGRSVPLYFTVTSLWGALDGSLLLWLLVIGAFGVLLARSLPPRPGALHAWAMTVLGVVTVFFFALAYFAANPFRRVDPAPADGPGPNPLLREHSAMGVHLPLLYIGYIGMIVPFAYGVAALVTGETGPAWTALARRWALAAWSFLTLGIVLGAWWSYAVLGWGGSWAWDPVENASLLPWLTATAALHMTLGRRRSGLTGWAVTLYSTTFLLVLVGTFLTRSGAVASVHSFSESPLGPMLLGFFLLVAAAVIGLLIWRTGRFAGSGPARPVLSRESVLLANAVLFVVLTAFVLTGTVFPIISEAVTGQRLSVGQAYFDSTAVPVFLVVLALMGTGPLVRRDRDTAGALAHRLAVPAAAGLTTIAVVGLLGRPGPLALAAFGVAAFVLAGLAKVVVTEWTAVKTAGRPAALAALARRRPWGGSIAHAGIAVAVAGIAASGAYTAHSEAEISLGQAVAVDGVAARMTGVDRAVDGDHMAAGVRLRLEQDGEPLGTFRPELHYYPARDMTVSAPAIRTRPAGDIYVTVTSISQDGQHATIRLSVDPLIGLVWAGGAISALGGVVSLASGRQALQRPAKAGTADAVESEAA